MEWIIWICTRRKQMETVEEAAMVHGIDPDALVKEINDFLAKDLA